MNEIFDHLALGVSAAISPLTLGYCLFGVTLGTLVGLLPGVGILATIAMLMPLTFHLDPMVALVMLAGIYYGAAYGGSTASILLNLPGTAATAVTCLDGYPMTNQGRGGVALFMTTIASFVGSIIGIAMLAAFAAPLATAAVRFGPQENFSLMVLGLVAASCMSTTSPLKSLAMCVIGVMFGLVGMDVTTGTVRFTFGVRHLYEGILLVALALGIFGLAELMKNAGIVTSQKVRARDITMRSMLPTREDWRRSWGAMLRGTGVGAFFGALPGAGGTVASFMSYALERRIHRRPEEFGKGAIEGVAGPEAANNSAIPTAFIPTLTLGIPGDAVMALLLAIFMIHGISPGANFIHGNPEMFWGLIISFLIGNIALVVLNIPLIGIWIRIITIPYPILFPIICAFLCIGIYSINYSYVDLLLMILFGFVGYGMYLARLPAAPMILGFILGPLLEVNLRRSLLISHGDFGTILTRPLSAFIMALSAAILLWMIGSSIYRRRLAGSS